MNYSVLIAFLLSMGVVLPAHASRTFLSSRILSTNSLFELALTDNEFRNMCRDASYVVFQSKPLFQKSCNKQDLARYFLPNDNCCIDVEENGSGDVDSIWLDLVAPVGENSFYSSQVCIEPQRVVKGALFTAFFDLCWFLNGLWAGINLAVIEAEHSLNVEEYNQLFPGALPGVRNFCDAVNQPDWCYGKLACNSLHKSGVDDIQFKLCYQLVAAYNGDFSIYGVTTIPTGKGVTGNYLFEPLVGTKNPSVGVGFNTVLCACEYDIKTIALLGDFKYRYVFKSHEMRSFDLINNGDWSRYLLVVTPSQTLNPEPGINSLMFNSQVTPGSTVELWTAAHYQDCNMHLEVGYNFWWRDAEKVCTLCPLAPEHGIFDMGGSFCSMDLTTASTANISQGPRGDNAAISDALFTPITQENINIASATQPSVLSNSFYLAAAYEVTRYCVPITLAFGAAYEIPHKSTDGYRQWTVWGTLGFAF